MKIVVLVKEVPDTYSDRRIDLETGLADRTASDAVLDEIGERALEVALSHADAHPGTEVVVLSMAPDSAAPAIRKTLAMGASSAVHIADERLRGADIGLTCEVLAAALTRTGFDLVIAGNQSTDGSGGVLPAMLAEKVGVPSATNLQHVEIGETAISGERVSDGAVLSVSAALPAVISVTERLPNARFPNLKGIMAAKKKPVETLDSADLGIDPDSHEASRSIMISIAERPPRKAGVKVTDDGTVGEKLAAFLIENQLA